MTDRANDRTRMALLVAALLLATFALAQHGNPERTAPAPAPTPEPAPTPTPAPTPAMTPEPTPDPPVPPAEAPAPAPEAPTLTGEGATDAAAEG